MGNDEIRFIGEKRLRELALKAVTEAADEFCKDYLEVAEDIRKVWSA